MRLGLPTLLAGLLLAATASEARAAGPEDWAALYNARLAASADRDPAAAFAIYETVLAYLPDDDPMRGEMALWLGRERYLAGEREGAYEALRIASSFDTTHDAARELMARMKQTHLQVEALPYEADFTLGTDPWLRGWPDGQEDDLQIRETDEVGTPALAWDVRVRTGHDDFLALSFDLPDGDPGPQRVRFVVKSQRHPSWLRVIWEDETGQRWSSSVIEVPEDEWTLVDLPTLTFMRADAPFDRARPKASELVMLEVRDVTAFHSEIRGANRLWIDDVEVR